MSSSRAELSGVQNVDWKQHVGGWVNEMTIEEPDVEVQNVETLTCQVMQGRSKTKWWNKF